MKGSEKSRDRMCFVLTSIGVGSVRRGIINGVIASMLLLLRIVAAKDTSSVRWVKEEGQLRDQGVDKERTDNNVRGY